MNDSRERRYSREELETIVARAVALQDRSDGLDSGDRAGQLQRSEYQEGLTLEMIREIAAEVGVDARFVEKAALSLRYHARPHGPGSKLLGGPTRHEVGGTLQPRLTTSAHSELVDRIRRDSGHEGEVREVMDYVEWATVGRLTKTTVEIRDDGNGTAVRVRVDASGIAAFTWIGSISLGVLAGGVVATSVDPATTLGVASMLGVGGGLGVGLARTVWARVSQSIRERAQRLRDDLVRPPFG